jgi:hypothetical protein
MAKPKLKKQSGARPKATPLPGFPPFQGRALIDSARELSGVLWQKGIGNALREWDGWAHDWPYWQQMIVRYVGGHD